MQRLGGTVAENAGRASRRLEILAQLVAHQQIQLQKGEVFKKSA